MSEVNLPSHDLCTGCGACSLNCPTRSISMEYDYLGVLYPRINTQTCIECGKCIKSCHLNHNNFHPISDVCFASYSTNDEVRKCSASGGIATELYKSFLSMGWHVFGVKYIPGMDAFYFEIKDLYDLLCTQNSKYLFAETRDVYGKIKELLNNHEKVLFIGVPCQVSGLVSYLGRRYDNLLLVDILCHGTCPSSYLNDHIHAIEMKYKRKCVRVSFRDPQFGTRNYHFTIYDERGLFYNQQVNDVDTYQIGYHKGLIYRENCYQCRYARKERVGDITLSDFSGLGKIDSYNSTKDSVSCIIVSTDRGLKAINQLIDNKRIYAEKRPISEAFIFDSMFQKPTLKHKRRDIFIKVLESTGSFEHAANTALNSIILCNRIEKLLHIKRVRSAVRRLFGNS